MSQQQCRQARSRRNLLQDLDIGGQLDLAAGAVLHVDSLVLAVAADDADQHRQPADRAELSLLDDRAVEHDLGPLDPVVLAVRLRDAVDVDRDGRLGAGGQAHAAARGDAPLGNLESLGLVHARAALTASNGDSPWRGSSGSLRTAPTYGTSVPSPIRSISAPR